MRVRISTRRSYYLTDLLVKEESKHTWLTNTVPLKFMSYTDHTVCMFNLFDLCTTVHVKQTHRCKWWLFDNV